MEEREYGFSLEGPSPTSSKSTAKVCAKSASDLATRGEAWDEEARRPRTGKVRTQSPHSCQPSAQAPRLRACGTEKHACKRLDFRGHGPPRVQAYRPCPVPGVSLATWVFRESDENDIQHDAKWCPSLTLRSRLQFARGATPRHISSKYVFGTAERVKCKISRTCTLGTTDRYFF